MSIEAPVRDHSDSARIDARVLVFVVAYNAEKTLAALLDRIPYQDIPARTEVLVIDDSSADSTFPLGVEYKRANRQAPLTVLRTPVNQGYGGNQKLGYRYALSEGFDHVALLHGDGQYPPELLPDLLRPLLEGEADAVFGSRMLEPGRALRGGMPLYKYVGNKILTRFQNLVLGTRLSEFHSGYRAYSVAALAALPFEHNTNDFHFDTEIIIQLLLHGKRIREIPIPTYYGDEICHVNGMRYAWNVTKATTLSRVQRLGLLYRRRFDALPPAESPYEPKLSFPSSHSMVLEAVPRGARVLDLGCGPGHLDRALVEEKGCSVTGVDRAPLTACAAVPGVRAVPWNLDLGIPPDDLDNDYDTVLALDIVEHLRSPEDFLDELREHFGGAQPRVLLTTPNVAFLVTRLSLLLGALNYGRRGILDRTHTRLFTFGSFRTLLEESGYRVDTLRGVPAPFPLALGDGRLARALLTLNRWLIRLWRGLFSYQIYAEAKLVPTVDQLLSQTLEASEVEEARITAGGG